MSSIKICVDEKTLYSELGIKYKDVIEFVKENYSFDIIENEKLNDYAYLSQIYQDYDFVLIFNSDKHYYSEKNLIYYPLDIYEANSKYLRNNDFSSFAQKKLMYHELSDIYMELIVNDTEKEIHFIEEIYKKYNNKGKKLIDFCCGVGRHVYGLSKKGFEVVGIDISENQIETAKKIHSNALTKYYIGDARNIKIKEKFNIAICMWTTYNYFSKDEELKEFLENAYEHLNNNGILILDAKNITSLNNFRIYHRSKNNDKIDLEQLIVKRVINNVQNSQYFLFIKQNNQCRFIMDEEFVRFYSLGEIKK